VSKYAVAMLFSTVSCLRIREYAKTKAVLYSNTAQKSHIIPIWHYPIIKALTKFQGLS